MDQIKSRKPHKKSRNGCLACKSRRIKCDEQKPMCYNCERYASECIYPPPKKRIWTPDCVLPITMSTPSSTEGAVPSQGNLSELASNTDQELCLNISQLHLLHHFTTGTGKTISAEPRNEEVYSSYLIKVAFHHPFLLHAILALAALHLSRLEPGRRPEYLLQAERHHAVSLNRFQEEISAMDEFNYKAVFLYSSVDFPYSWGMLTSVDLEPGDTFDSILSNMVLIRSVRPLIDEFYDMLTKSELSRLRPLDTQSIDWDAVEPVASTELVGLRKFVEVMPQLYTEDITEVYRHAVHILMIVFSAAGQSLFRPSDALLKIWIHFVKPRFMALLSERQPGALIIFAHFAVLVKRASHYWFLVGVAEKILTMTDALLPNEWNTWLDWPREQLAISTGNTSEDAV